jgi:hypothetical protein
MRALASPFDFAARAGTAWVGPVPYFTFRARRSGLKAAIRRKQEGWEER